MPVKYSKAKAVVAAVGTLCTVVGGIIADDVVDADEVGTLVAQLILAAGTVWAVWRVPNKPMEE